jgi:hypothetical protein
MHVGFCPCLVECVYFLMGFFHLGINPKTLDLGLFLHKMMIFLDHAIPLFFIALSLPSSIKIISGKPSSWKL